MKGRTFYSEGMKLLDAGKFTEALSLFHKALELEPDQPDYLSDRAVTYFHLQKKDLAMIDLNLAQKLDPKNPYRYSSRAFVKDSLGDLEGAIRDYEKAIELDPEDAVALNNLGMLEEKFGYKKKAEERFKKADALMKNDESGEKYIPMSDISSEKAKKDSEKENKTIENKNGIWKHVKLAVFTREGRKEFFTFIKKGFKLK